MLQKIKNGERCTDVQIDIEKTLVYLSRYKKSTSERDGDGEGRMSWCKKLYRIINKSEQNCRDLQLLAFLERRGESNAPILGVWIN